MELELRLKEAQLREAALAAKVGTCSTENKIILLVCTILQDVSHAQTFILIRQYFKVSL